jgi:MFS family permease
MLAGTKRRFAEIGAVAPRAFWYVFWGTLVNRLGGFVVPLLTIYLTKDRAVDVSTAGVIVSVFGLGQVIASIVGGQMSDRLGRKITMVTSLFGGAVAMLALGFARDLATIAVMVGVVGFVGELYRPAVSAFIADVIPEPHRVQAYALLHWVINIGFAFAAIVGGTLADLDFTLLFVADAASMAIYGVIVLVAVPETRPVIASTGATAIAPRSRSWLLDREFVVFVGIACAITMLPIQSGATLSAHMSAQGFSSAEYGLVMGVNGVIIIALQPVLGAALGGRDPSRVLAVSALIYGAGLALHGAGAYLWLHAFAVALWTFGEILESPTRSAIGAAMAPPDARGRYQGALVLSWGLSWLAGPTVGTWLWEHVGPSAPWIGCLILGALGAIAVMLTAPARRRRMGSTRARRSGSS